MGKYNVSGDGERLVVFGSGFLASNFVSYANKSLNWESLVIYRNYLNPALDSVKNVRLHFSMGDLVACLEEWCPVYILIAVGPSFVADINNNIESSIDAHLNTTLFILNAISAMQCKSVKKIIIIGSASEYGAFPEYPVTESHPLCPSDPYGTIKLTQYCMGKYFFEKHSLPIVHARQFNASGIGQSQRFLIPSVCAQFASARIVPEKIIKAGNLNVRRDFLAVSDVVKAYHYMFMYGEIGNAYNVCSGVTYSVEELILLAGSISNLKFSIESDQQLMRSGDGVKTVICGNPAKLQRLGWEPYISMQDLLASMIEKFKTVTNVA
jgi:GDP-4-dehydro-6-deoxy-D-mannose reductase